MQAEKTGGFGQKGDHGFYCSRVGTLPDDDKAQNKAMAVAEDEHRVVIGGKR